MNINAISIEIKPPSLTVVQESHSYKTHCIVLTKSGLHVKVIDIEQLRGSGEGLKKLQAYLNDKRFGYIDSDNKLHLHHSQSANLKDRHIEALTFKAGRQGISKGPDLSIQNITDIDDDEYDAYQDILNCMKMAHEAKEKSARTSWTDKNFVATQLLQEESRHLTSTLDSIFALHLCDIIDSMLKKFAEMEAAIKAQKEEDYKKQLRLEEVINYKILMHDVQCWAIKQAEKNAAVLCC